ncbi:MAG: protoglobin domain-containing protein [Thermostichales cyanobacterium SZTDM-1c_bins_54]
MMAISPEALLTALIARTNFSPADREVLKANQDWGAQLAPTMSDHFYAYLDRDPEMAAVIAKHNRQRLGETFIAWFKEMFTGMDDWGSQYAQRRWKIGIVHVRIGIGPQHVVPAMATVVLEVGQQIREQGKPEDLRTALAKVCMMDLSFIEQAYLESAYRAVQQETGMSEALFKRLIATGIS